MPNADDRQSGMRDIQQVLVVPRHLDKYLVKKIWTCLRSEKIRLGYGRERLAGYILDTVLDFGSRHEIRYENGSRFDDEVDVFPSSLTIENFLKNGVRLYKSPERYQSPERMKASVRTLNFLYILMVALHPESIKPNKDQNETVNLPQFIEGVDNSTSIHDIAEQQIPSAIRLYRYEGSYAFGGFADKFNSWSSEKRTQFRDDLLENSSSIEDYNNEIHFDFDAVLLRREKGISGQSEYQLISADIWEHLAFNIFPQSESEQVKSKEHRRYWPKGDDERFLPKLRKQTLAVSLAEQILSYPGNHDTKGVELKKPRTTILKWENIDGSSLFVMAKDMEAETVCLDPENDMMWIVYIEHVFRRGNTIDFYSEYRGKHDPERMRTASIALPLTPTDKKLANYLLNSWDY